MSTAIAKMTIKIEQGSFGPVPAEWLAKHGALTAEAAARSVAIHLVGPAEAWEAVGCKLGVSGEVMYRTGWGLPCEPKELAKARFLATGPLADGEEIEVSGWLADWKARIAELDAKLVSDVEALLAAGLPALRKRFYSGRIKYPMRDLVGVDRDSRLRAIRRDLYDAVIALADEFNRLADERDAAEEAAKQARAAAIAAAKLAWLRDNRPDLAAKIEAGYECTAGLKGAVVEAFAAALPTAAPAARLLTKAEEPKECKGRGTPSDAAFAVAATVGKLPGVAATVGWGVWDECQGEVVEVDLACPWDPADRDYVTVYLVGDGFAE